MFKRVPEEVRAKLGQEFEIVLPSTPSTGYVWNPEACPEGLEFLGSRVDATGGAGLAGGTVAQIFSFRGKAVGGTVLRFVLKRTWEQTPIQRHAIRVTID